MSASDIEEDIIEGRGAQTELTYLDAGTPERDRHWAQRLPAVFGANPNLVSEDVDAVEAVDAFQNRLGGVGISVDNDG
ncbi:MAG: hypothetical protein CL433_05225, partial [Acidimicrobiaceae bacterium]|nr:hypothetical protein [Acidimicrobiaceae bacterium]